MVAKVGVVRIVAGHDVALVEDLDVVVSYFLDESAHFALEEMVLEFACRSFTTRQSPVIDHSFLMQYSIRTVIYRVSKFGDIQVNDPVS